MQSYDKPSATVLALNHSDLFNTMIYPFTRFVIYGIIWYQGEQNVNYNYDVYACSFSKMIQAWREIWHERTNGLTDIEFPFGFVQVSITVHYEDFYLVCIAIDSYKQ